MLKKVLTCTPHSHQGWHTNWMLFPHFSHTASEFWSNLRIQTVFVKLWPKSAHSLNKLIIVPIVFAWSTLPPFCTIHSIHIENLFRQSHFFSSIYRFYFQHHTHPLPILSPQISPNRHSKKYDNLNSSKSHNWLQTSFHPNRACFHRNSLLVVLLQFVHKANKFVNSVLIIMALVCLISFLFQHFLIQSIFSLLHFQRFLSIPTFGRNKSVHFKIALSFFSSLGCWYILDYTLELLIISIVLFQFVTLTTQPSHPYDIPSTHSSSFHFSLSSLFSPSIPTSQHPKHPQITFKHT